MIADDSPMLQLVVALVAGLGGLNWGLVELIDMDLLVEVGLSGDLLGYGYLAIGVAGAILLIDTADAYLEE